MNPGTSIQLATPSTDGREKSKIGVPALAAQLVWGVIGACVFTGCGRSPDQAPGELRDAARIEGAPMCPWRNPTNDVAAWFPEATRSDTEVRILSALRPEMTQRLGRAPTAEDNALYVHRLWKDSDQLGEIIVRRVKGESGAIELVVAFEPDGRLRGVRFQRSREPEGVTAALNENWLASFRGKRASDRFEPGADLPAVPDSARITANAVTDGVRSLTVLRELAAGPGALRRPAPEVATGHFH